MRYKIKAFFEMDWLEYYQLLVKRINAEINMQTKEYILSIDEEEYKKFLFETYRLEKIYIDYNNENIGHPETRVRNLDDRFLRKIRVEEYYFTVTYPFLGSPELFMVKPTRFYHKTQEILVDDINYLVSFDFAFNKMNKDPHAFEIEKQGCYCRAFENVSFLNEDVEKWNKELHYLISNIFNSIKDKYKSERDFFAAINVKVNKNTETVFSTPIIKKKDVPRPSVSDNKEFSSEPTMSLEMYLDVIKVIYEAGKSMEKKPSLYIDKDEEGLRDQILFLLETRYEGITATGETFNRAGKTDILLKYADDNSNLFVAECKFWKGASELNKAINQLFERYLTWRDSKTALIFFVKNQSFTQVLNIIKNESKKHKYFSSEKNNRGESSFAYEFFLPQDREKRVFLEIIAFHFDK
ncbi:hypothetical protein H1S01_15430 [Heliobacterium chlorum]|uniref:Restriction endonuclease type IV Mrr domain-containing protein n=1 Tax=Heliobacterium chlorum TaxID=2698 RepID=A0ABR7T6L9_HELCL|nr:hypothetical protein [Heliobacterium chlorum]MBC9785877.1 hypothetical protein [Heliobacterium chlorum]